MWPFRKKTKKKRFKSNFERRIDSLKNMFTDTEARQLMYEGPSEEFLAFCRIENLSVTLTESTTPGSVAQLAYRELSNLYDNEKLSLRERYKVGRTLEKTPLEILNNHNLLPKTRFSRELAKARKEDKKIELPPMTAKEGKKVFEIMAARLDAEHYFQYKNPRKPYRINIELKLLPRKTEYVLEEIAA
jgi:hypothetical protein